MNTNLLNIIKQITAEYGEAVLADPRRLKAFFSDLAKDEPKPLRIAFGRCVEAGAYAALKDAPDTAERAEHKTMIAQRLRDEHGLDITLCVEALDILEAAIYADAYNNHSMAHTEKSDSFRAIADHNQAGKLNPNNVLPPPKDSAMPVTVTAANRRGDDILGFLVVVGVIVVGLILYVAARNVVIAYDKTNKTQPGQLLLTFTGHSEGVRTIAYSPDGKRIISGSGDKTIKIWDAETGLLIRTISGHGYRIMSAAYSPDGRRIVSSDPMGTVKIWDAENGQEIRTLSGHGTYTVESVAYSPNGQRVMSAANDGTVKIWDAETGRLIRTLSARYVRSAAYSPDGQHIIYASGDGTMTILDVENGREIHTLTGHSASRDGNMVIENEGRETRLLSEHTVAYSPDGRHIVSAALDGTVKILDAETGQLIHTLSEHSEKVGTVAYSPNGQCIVSGSDDKTVKVWDAENGQLIRTLFGNGGTVESVAYSPDGRRIVSGSGDGTIKVWDAGE
jgi:WD40 repeat protein